MEDEEMRSALIRRRSKTPASSGGLTTKEGIIAGLVAGKQLLFKLMRRWKLTRDPCRLDHYDCH